jgi:hypothetical protein
MNRLLDTEQYPIHQTIDNSKLLAQINGTLPNIFNLLILQVFAGTEACTKTSLFERPVHTNKATPLTVAHLLRKARFWQWL